jgi:trigger factor
MSDALITSAPAARSFRHTIRRDAGSKVSLEVEVDAERLARQADRVFERHNQKAKIPGFRPGKAPRAMYERSRSTIRRSSSRSSSPANRFAGARR